MIRACQRDRIERDLLPALILATGDQGSQQNLQGATFADVNPQSAVRLSIVSRPPASAHIQLTAPDQMLSPTLAGFPQIRALTALVSKTVSAASTHHPVGE